MGNMRKFAGVKGFSTPSMPQLAHCAEVLVKTSWLNSTWTGQKITKGKREKGGRSYLSNRGWSTDPSQSSWETERRNGTNRQGNAKNFQRWRKAESYRSHKKIKQEREVADKGEPDLINNLAIQLDFAHHALGKHITMLLPPFHESELNGFVTVDCNKVSVFVTIP